jgi:hypothetical protein
MTNYDEDENEQEISYSDFYQLSELIANKLDNGATNPGEFCTTFG